MDSPTATRSRSRWPLVLAGVLLLAGGGFAAWWFWPEPKLPTPDDPRYEEYVEAFEVGTAALDAGLNDRADKSLTEAINLVPGEPAGWANRGLMHLRVGVDLDKAESDLNRASKLAGDNADIEELWSYLKERRSNVDAAIAHLEKALKTTPDDPRRLFRLAELVDARSSKIEAEKERLDVFGRILSRRPTSLPVLATRLTLSVRVEDKAALTDTLKRLDALAPGWNATTRTEYAALKKAIEDKAAKDQLQLAASRFGNMLKAEFGYARSSNELSPPVGFVGSSMQQFVRLAPLKTTPYAPDLELTFEKRQKSKLTDGLAKGVWDELVPFWPDGTSPLGVLAGNREEVRSGDGKVRLKFPSGEKGVRPMLNGIVPLDWDNDGRTDILLAGAGGLRFFRQNEKGEFTDVTAASKLPEEVLKGNHYGAWAADLDLDGDLDILLTPRKGPATLLRNNANGTFTSLPIFPGVDSPRDFVWVDLDNDGAPDAALLDDQGRLHLFLNERGGLFKKAEVPAAKHSYAGITAADLGEGEFRLVAVETDHSVFSLSRSSTGNWERSELRGSKSTGQPAPGMAPGEVRLQAIDLDRNGALDLVLRKRNGGKLWLGDGGGGFKESIAFDPWGLAEVVAGDDSDLALLSLGTGPLADAGPHTYSIKRTKDYRAVPFRLRAETNTSGDDRINSFALGTQLEVRSGSLIVKQIVRHPVVSIGLGSRNRIGVTRLVWPNGATQFEFDKAPAEPIKVVQRLKTSCPFLFTWDGSKMVFVTDFCWSTPLGLYINTQKRGGFMQTTEWLKVPGHQLAPRDGVYDVRVNANLWETHYLDLLSLMVVDHPPDTEMHVDERFFLTPTPPRIYLTTPSRPVAKALDHNGKDVTYIVRERDGKYLATAGLGKYQGLTRDHWVEVDAGDIPGEGPVYLLATGWLQPTDSSINVAIEQRDADRPTPLTLEVPDGKGGWKQAGPPLGFPPGKNKTMVIRLDGLDGPGPARRVRLRTNMEIYWDSLRVARGLDEKQCVTKPLTPTTADLRFRGVVRMTRADRFSPEIPHYDQLINQGQYWRDLIGYHTRFGDVRELVEKVDDRYVMMNAGDELRLTFAAPDAPKAGWKRDFVWVSDGWTKDGDLNTRFSKTVLPLPSHDMKGYETPPGRLQDDPVYRRHRKDWEVYHTRYVTPAVFEMGLRAYRLGR